MLGSVNQVLAHSKVQTLSILVGGTSSSMVVMAIELSFDIVLPVVARDTCLFVQGIEPNCADQLLLDWKKSLSRIVIQNNCKEKNSEIYREI